jgi:hypothetical protein
MCIGAVTMVFMPASARLKILFAWMLLCALALSPVRYMLFQVVAAAAYPWQSLKALLSTLVLAIYIPIVWGLLTALAIVLPVFVATSILGKTATPRLSRVFACAVAFPVLCIIGSSLYYEFAFPLAARAVYWLDPADVIRSGNGPAYLTFKFIAMPYTPMSFPVPAEELSGSDLDLMRLHLASAYMSPEKRAWVLRRAYPKLFERLYQRRSGTLSNFTLDGPLARIRSPRLGQPERCAQVRQNVMSAG